MRVSLERCKRPPRLRSVANGVLTQLKASRMNPSRRLNGAFVSSKPLVGLMLDVHVGRRDPAFRPLPVDHERCRDLRVDSFILCCDELLTMLCSKTELPLLAEDVCLAGHRHNIVAFLKPRRFFRLRLVHDRVCGCRLLSKHFA